VGVGDKLHPHATRHDSHHSPPPPPPPPTVRRSFPRPFPRVRASWNMHDMLMRLVPNLIIQFHGGPRQPPGPAYLSLLHALQRRARARAHMRGISFAPSRHMEPAFLMTRAI